jgi:hypothetical protein
MDRALHGRPNFRRSSSRPNASRAGTVHGTPDRHLRETNPETFFVSRIAINVESMDETRQRLEFFILRRLRLMATGLNLRSLRDNPPLSPLRDEPYATTTSASSTVNRCPRWVRRLFRLRPACPSHGRRLLISLQAPRPRIRLTIRQRTRVLRQWPEDQ